MIETNQIYIILFIAALFIFVNYRDPKAVFFICIAFIIFYMIIRGKVLQDKKLNLDVTSHLQNIIKKFTNTGYQITDDKYYVHKLPLRLKYIERSDFKDIVYQLRFIAKYDAVSYERFVSYLEYFLKLHYLIMMDKYDYETHFSILVDVRNEILNTLMAVYYNVPKNIDVYLLKYIRKMQALTHRYIKVLCNKFGQDYSPPYDFDAAKDDHYNVF